MTGSRIARMVAVTICAVLVGACSSPALVPTARVPSLTAGAPTGGLSRDQAIVAALQQSPGATGVLSATQGRARDFDPAMRAVPADTQVWAVVVSGTFPFSCGPALPPDQTHAPCPAAGTTMTVLLDYRSGMFIESFGTSGPQPTPAPSATPAAVQLPPLSVLDTTTVPFDVVINGLTVTTLSPGTQADPIPAAELPPLPWAIQARTMDGFVLATATMNDGRPISGRFDLSCGRIDIWSRIPILGPANGPGHPGDCGPAAFTALFADPNFDLDLAPIPSDAPPALIDEARAVKIAQKYTNVAGVEPTYVGHGQWHRQLSTTTSTVWLVITKVPDMAPIPVGPGCPPSNKNCQAWAVNDYGIVFVSDQTHDVLGAAAAMRQVNAPGASPSPAPPSPGPVSGVPYDGAFVPAAVLLRDDGSIVVAGATGDGVGSGVIASSQDGSTWTALRLGAGPIASLAANGSALFVSTACHADAPPECADALLSSSDAGATWLTSAERISRVAFANAQSGWAIKGTSIAPSLMLSADGGATWQPAASPCRAPWRSIRDVSFSADGDGWLACTGNARAGSEDKQLLAIFSGGAGFDERSVVPQGQDPGIVLGALPSANALMGISIRNTTSGWLWTDRGLFSTDDSGASWQSLTFGSPAAGRTMVAAHVTAGRSGVVLLRDRVTRMVQLLRTLDAGTTWAELAHWPLAG